MIPSASQSRPWKFIYRWSIILAIVGIVIDIPTGFVMIALDAYGWPSIDLDLLSMTRVWLSLPMLIVVFADISISRWREMNARNENFRRRWEAIEDERNRPIGRVARERPRPRRLPRKRGFNRRTAL